MVCNSQRNLIANNYILVRNTSTCWGQMYYCYSLEDETAPGRARLFGTGGNPRNRNEGSLPGTWLRQIHLKCSFATELSQRLCKIIVDNIILPLIWGKYLLRHLNIEPKQFLLLGRLVVWQESKAKVAAVQRTVRMEKQQHKNTSALIY